MKAVLRAVHANCPATKPTKNPSMDLHAINHHSVKYVVTCNKCGTVHAGQFPKDVVKCFGRKLGIQTSDRVAELCGCYFNRMFGVDDSITPDCNFNGSVSRRVGTRLFAIKEESA